MSVSSAASIAAEHAPLVVRADEDDALLRALLRGAGVGGGIVLNGELLEGASGNAGHIGHVVVEPNGVSLTNFTFSQEFNSAIEQKQVAQQMAEKQNKISGMEQDFLDQLTKELSNGR